MIDRGFDVTNSGLLRYFIEGNRIFDMGDMSF
jgi:hypothetical protein